MKAYTIIIASNDHHYNNMMMDKLKQRYSCSSIINVLSDIFHDDGINLMQTQTDSHILLFLGIAIDDCNHDCDTCRSASSCLAYRYLHSMRGNSNFTVHYFNVGIRDSNKSAENNQQLRWPAPVSDIAKITDDIIKTNSTLKNEKSKQPFDNQSANEGILCMNLSLGSHYGKRLDVLIKEQLKKGKRIYYLAIMPGWCMQLCCAPDSSGPDLSALLFSIYQHCPPEAGKIGIYTQLHPDGYFQFRPPARGDDLISCEPEYLRKMLLLIRQKIKSDTAETICWIDCRDISIQTAGRLAALCDYLLLDIPTDEGYAAVTARREAGLLLAGLPNSCSIFENDQQLMENLQL